MQAEALRDMLEWVEGDGDACQRLQQRLAWCQVSSEQASEGSLGS